MNLLYSIVFVLLANSVSAQQPFQGTIIYNLHADKEKNDAELSVQFGINKIKIKFKQSNDYDKSYLIVDVDSGRVFTIDSSHKTYLSKKLSEINLNERAPVSKTIAGFTTSPVTTSGNGIASFFGGFLAGKMTYYVANDLFYPLPPKYEAAPELMMINNNHIVLGLTIVATTPKEIQTNDSTAQMTITAEARQVKPQVFDLAEFSIPVDFTRQDRFTGVISDSAYADSQDSIAVMADTAVAGDTIHMIPPSVPKPKKSKPSAPKKTIPAKGEAIKPKKTPNRS